MPERVVLVTGGTSGIGAACAEALLAAGYRVAVNFGSHQATASSSASHNLGHASSSVTRNRLRHRQCCELRHMCQGMPPNCNLETAGSAPARAEVAPFGDAG